MIDLVRGQSAAAVDRATATLAKSPTDDIAHMFLIFTSVSGLGDLGRIDEIESTANAGYRLAETSAEISHLRLPLAVLEGIAYRLAGALTPSDAVISRIRHDTIDVPFQQAWHGFFTGLSAMSRGDLTVAQHSLLETLAHLD